MKKILTLTLVSYLLGLLCACNLEKIEPGGGGVPSTFENHIGGINPDAASRAVELSDGSFVITGYGTNQLVKINGKTGVPFRTYSGKTGSSTFWVEDIIRINNDNLIICGFRADNGIWKGMVMRFDSLLSPNLEVNSGTTSTFPNFDWYRNVIQATSGGYILTGIHSNIPFLGTMLADFSTAPNTYPFPDYYLDGGGFIQTKEGSYMFSAESPSTNSQNLIKTKKNIFYEIDWSIPFNFSITDVIEASNGDFIISGINDNKPQIAVVSPSQSITYNTTFGNKEGGFSQVVEVSDGYIFAGNINPGQNGGQDGFIIKLDKEFQFKWKKEYGGALDDYFFGVINTSDGGFLCYGSTRSFGAGDEDMYVIKLDKDGNL